MSRINDRQSLGELPLQDHRPGLDPAAANSVTAARVEERDVLGRWVIEGHERSSAPRRTVGDLRGGFLAFPDPAAPARRSQPIWSFALPAVARKASIPPSPATTVPAGSGGVRPLALRPLRDRDYVEDSQLALDAAVHRLTSGIPKGHPGVVLDGVKLGRGSSGAAQEELFLPAALPLIAANRKGEPRIGSLVYDLEADSALDEQRRAHLQSVFDVRRLPSGCSYEAADVVALQLGPTGLERRAGFGLTMQRAEVGAAANLGFLSHQQSGPLDNLNAILAHKLGADADGVPIYPTGINTQALYRDGLGRDAPIEFESVEFVPPFRFPFLSQVHLRHDSERQHPFVCGQAPGEWRFEAEIPLTVLEDVPPVPPRIPREFATPTADVWRAPRALPPTVDRVREAGLVVAEDRPATFTGVARAAGGVLFRPFATRIGAERVWGGGGQRELVARVAAAPDVAALVPIGHGDGTWNGLRSLVQAAPGRAGRGLGGIAILPARYASPEGLELVLRGDLDPNGAVAATPETTATLWLPAGLARLDWAHPSGGRTSGSGVGATLSRQGIRQLHSSNGVELRGLNPAGEEITSQYWLLRHEGDLEHARDGGLGGVTHDLLTSGGAAALLRGRSSRGTIASPLDSLGSDDVLELRAERFRGAVYEEIGAIRFQVEATGSQSGRVEIETWRSGVQVAHRIDNGGLTLRGQKLVMTNNAITTSLTLDATGMTAFRNQVFQDKDGTIALLADITALGSALAVVFNAAAFSPSFGTLHRCDSSGGGFTASLPAIVAGDAGKVTIIKDGTGSSVGANKVTIQAAGADDIDGSPSVGLPKWGSITLRHDGVSRWLMVG